MIGLIARSRPAAWSGDSPSPADLREQYSLAVVQDNTRLWEDPAGNLHAYAVLDAQFCNLYFDLDREAIEQGLGAAIVTWGVQRLAPARQDVGLSCEALSLDTSCRSEDEWRCSFLPQNGFVRQQVTTVHLARRLDASLPEPALPAGYQVRALHGRAEVEEVVALHRAAWGTQNMTVAWREAMMAAVDYDPALDLVAVAPGGALAAYCFCFVPHEENRQSGRRDAYTDPLATHPAHQRQGLAQALLAAGMLLLRQRGVEVVRLGTSSDNLAMLAAARGVGFEVDYETIWFARPV